MIEWDWTHQNPVYHWTLTEGIKAFLFALHWRTQSGLPGTRAPGSIFFHAAFGENNQNNRLAPPPLKLAPPPLGSATALSSMMVIYTFERDIEKDFL